MLFRSRFGANAVVPASLLSRASLRVREREGERRTSPDEVADESGDEDAAE